MKSKIDKLLTAFSKAVNEPWGTSLSGQEKVWFLVYDPMDQRKIDLQIGEFEIKAKEAGRDWAEISLKKVFPEWMAAHDYKEEYFADPASLVDQLEYEFKDHVIEHLIAQVESINAGPSSLIAITGVGSLFGFCRLSDILKGASDAFEGRVLVFFPGEFSSNQYRLLDARNGWNYLARPITA